MAVNIRQLRADAQQTLSPRLQTARKLVFISQGVMLGVQVLLALLDVLLEVMMDGHGGLSGMPLRSVLSTVTAMVSLAASFLTPFWSAGLLFAFLGIARQQECSTGHLTEGFRRFGPYLRYILLTFLLITGISIGIVYLFSILSAFLPTNPEFSAIIIENQDAFFADPEAVLAQIPRHLLLEAMLSSLLLFFVLFLIIMIPLLYRLRLANFAIMDKPGTGALAAMSYSMRTMKGNCISAFKLDLHFWWYYLIALVISSIPQLQPLLPFNSSVSHLLLYCIYALGALTLNWYFMPLVHTTYAKFYTSLRGE
jgi:uncharacterized membrane protein